MGLYTILYSFFCLVSVLQTTVARLSFFTLHAGLSFECMSFVFWYKIRKVHCTNKYLDAQYICTCIGQMSGPDVRRPHRQLNIYDMIIVRMYVMCTYHNWFLPADVELHCCQDKQIKSLEFVYMAWKSVTPVSWFGVRPSRRCRTSTLMNVFLDARNVTCQNVHNSTWCTCWTLPVYATVGETWSLKGHSSKMAARAVSCILGPAWSDSVQSLYVC